MAKRRSFPAEIFDPTRILAPALERGVAAWAQAVLSHGDRGHGGADPAEANLLTFTKEAWPIISPAHRFIAGWHTECICEHLSALRRRQITKLVLNAPPRHAKSIPSTVMLPCWVWATEPTARFCYTSWSTDLSYFDQDRCRIIVKSAWYQRRWGHLVQIMAGQDRQDEIINTRNGMRIATNMMRPPLGKGFEWIIADDPNQAVTTRRPREREEVIDKWEKGFSTRYNDPNDFRLLVLQQRVAERDLSGHLRERGYEVLCLPAFYEPKRYLLPEPGQPTPKDHIEPTTVQKADPRWLDGPTGSKREKEGDLLWPERFNESNLDEQKETLQADFNGQYQQRPSPEKGQFFDRAYFRYFSVDEYEGKKVFVLNPWIDAEKVIVPFEQAIFFQVCDTAKKIKDTSAYTAVVTFAAVSVVDSIGQVTRRCLLVWDAWRQRLTIPEQYSVIQELRKGRGDFDIKTRRWRVLCEQKPWPVPIAFQFVEDAGSGEGILQQATADGVPIEALPTGNVSKESRAQQASSLYERGVIFHNELMPLRGDFEDELVTFPTGPYADQCDCCAYAAILFNRHRYLTRATSNLFIYPNAEDVRRREEENVYRHGDIVIRFPDD